MSTARQLADLLDANGDVISSALDNATAHTPEGTVVKSTGEGGGTKFLREDGDGTSSWQVPTDTDTVYTHPTADGSKHVPAASGSASGQLLTSTGTGTEPTWQAAPQGVSNSKLFYFGSFT